MPPSEVMGLPWSRRKRLISEHNDLQTLRQRKQEEAIRKARGKR